MSNGINTSNINYQETNQEVEIMPFKVFIRIRPLNDKERQINNVSSKSNPKEKHALLATKSILLAEDNLIFVLDPLSFEVNGKKERSFVFDNIFTEKNSNFDIFEGVIKSTVDNILQGYNSTALAYGVTGTGKSHTMFGSREYLDELAFNDLNINAEKGVCFYALDYLFNKINMLSEERTFQVKISYLEIYNEQVIDLLSEKSKSLMIVEDSIKGVVVPDLTEFTVTNSIDMMKLVIEGNARRTMAPTNQNQFSSRSHAIIQVIVDQRSKVRDTKEEYLISKFLIVDLAGSERGGLDKGLRTQEGANINKSLLSLGNCINILSDKTKKGAFVPYRDSKLTRLMKDSLGGNIQTVMIACVSPSSIAYDDTLNTLKYATRARIIQKKISKNVKEVDVHISQYKEIIDSLKNEIDQLKSIIQSQQMIINQKDINLDANLLNSDDLKDSRGRSRSQIKEDSQIKKEKSPFRSNLTQSILQKPPIAQPSNRNSSCKMRTNTNSDIMSRSTIMNKNQNTKITQLVRNHSSSIRPSINLDTYKTLLENAANNLNNLNQSINPDGLNLEDILIPFEVLEKQVENLNSDKIVLQEIIEKSHIRDRDVEEKYKLINTFYDKYLELINEKLIENIEQNMILQFNMKEIIDLNSTNDQHLDILFTQLSNYDTFKKSPSADESEFNDEYEKIYEEIKSIKIAIQENNIIKERISESLERNLKIKNVLKKILLKLISNNKDNKQKLPAQKDEKTYNNLKKEKEELETKNKKIQMHLSALLKEKNQKTTEMNMILSEFQNMKKLLEEKDKKILEMEKEMNKLCHSLSNNKIDEIRSDECQLKENILPNQDNYIISCEMKNEKEKFTDYVTENVEINLQDDYFNLAPIRRSLEKTQRKKSQEDLIRQSEDNFIQGQNIKYIINQTNNIVNNNINKIIQNEKEKRKPGNSMHRHNTAKNNINIYTNPKPNLNNLNHYNNLKNVQRDSYAQLGKRSQSKSPDLFKKNSGNVYKSNLNDNNHNSNNYNRPEKNMHRPDSKNKKINPINSYKDIHAIRNYHKFSHKFNNEEDVIIKKRMTDKEVNNLIDKKLIDESLSISYVSLKEENDFNSEIDIMVGMQEKEKVIYTPKKKLRKNEINYLRENSPCITPRPEDRVPVKNEINNIHPVFPSSSSSSIDVRDNYKAETLKTPQNLYPLPSKNMNVRKFLNSNKILPPQPQPQPHNPIFTNNLQKEKPVQPKRRDYSPSPCNLLKQARLEKQLKNKGDENISKINDAYSMISGTSQSLNVKKTSTNKLVSKNSIDFVEEYEQHKYRLNTDQNEKIDDTPDPLQNNLNKNELVESYTPSVIDLDSMMHGNFDVASKHEKDSENLKIVKNDFVDMHDKDKEYSPDDLLKCLNDVIKNPKIIKFLDKK